MRIYIGADHNGFEMKHDIAVQLGRAGYDVVDTGDKKRDPNDDYPQFAAQLVAALLASDDNDSRGILICGSGQGVCIAANRFKGIRAALAWNMDEVHASRNDDDANVLCLPARYMKVDEAVRLTEAWLATPFAGAPRFRRRIKEIDELT